MAEAVDLSFFARPRPDGAMQVDLAVEGVSCGGCIARIEKGMRALPGIVDARLNFTNRRLNVAWTRDVGKPSDIIGTLERMGYRAHPFQPEQVENAEAAHWKWLLRCLAVAGFAAMNIMLLSVSVWSGNATDITPETRDYFHWLSALIALPAAAYAGQPFFQSAWRALKARQLNMDVPISLGVILALGLSVTETVLHGEHAYFDSAIMLLFFLLCGRTLDFAMRRKTRAVAGNLAALRAEVAHRFDAKGAVVTVPVGVLRVGDRLLVRPGERVPADGAVVDGPSQIDESLVTGETAHRPVGAGDAVHAGSLNYGAAFTMSVAAVGADTLLAEVDRLLEQAITAKSRYQHLADRAARLYSPVVHVTAALTAAGWLIAGASLHQAIVTAIAVLIITCPCALALAIPAAQVVASGAMFRAGIFLNSGDAIERLAEVDTIVFDKTGTLTLPEPQVDNADAVDPALLETAARLAVSSHHPLAMAVARSARSASPYDNTIEEPGCGVRAMVDGEEARLGSLDFTGVARPATDTATSGASQIAFAHAGKTAVFVVRQTLRPDAVDVVKALSARGFDLCILSGDRLAAVAPIADALGISAWQAGLTPAGKIAALDSLKQHGRKVLMVGDGLNDAPALAATHASMSPISAADVTQAQADAVFLGERLAPVLDALTIARRARRIMLENLGLAIVYNAFAVPLAIAGFVTPLIAAAAMSGSSILVTLNALRAKGAMLRGRKASGPA